MLAISNYNVMAFCPYDFRQEAPEKQRNKNFPIDFQESKRH